MALKKLRDGFGPSAIVGLSAIAAVAVAPAYAEDKPTSPTTESSMEHPQKPALVRAGNFGKADRKNVGIMMYYGTGNGSSPEEVGEFIEAGLEDAAEQRGIDLDAEYFFTKTDHFEGIVVGYLIGGLSIDGMDIREAIKPETYDMVIDKRQSINMTLASFPDLIKE